MTEVIEGHRLITGETWDGDYYQFCTCQQDAMPELDGRYADHLAAALSAAGFGLVADTKAEALEEAADEFEDLPANKGPEINSGTWEWFELFPIAHLRARAAALRGDS